jgi:hypothetical protein
MLARERSSGRSELCAARLYGGLELGRAGVEPGAGVDPEVYAAFFRRPRRICTEGTGCSANRELGDLQSIAVNNQGNADVAWVRSLNNGASAEVLFTH